MVRKRRGKAVWTITGFAISVAFCVSTCFAETELKLYLAFDEGQGHVSVDKASGLKAELHNTTWVAGKSGKALCFNGKDRNNNGSFVVLPATRKMPFFQTFEDGPFTMEAWTKLDSRKPPNQTAEVLNTSPDRGPGYRLRFAYGAIGFMSGTGKPNAQGKVVPWAVGSNPAVHKIKLDAWNHVAVARDAEGTLTLYLNGEAVAKSKGPFAVVAGNQPITIGAYMQGYAYHFQGIIDEVKIYKGTRTGEEILKESRGLGENGFVLPRLPSATAPAKATRPVQRAAVSVKALRTGSPPVIDGQLTETCWKTAPRLTRFLALGTDTPAPFQTTAYVLYDDNAIYVGTKCVEPDPSKINLDRLFADCIEIMLDPSMSRSDYIHLAINPSGAKYDARRGQTGFVAHEDWGGDWQAKGFVGKDYWSVEAAIPFFMLQLTPKTSSTWGFNLCRTKSHPRTIYSSIVKSSGGYHTPADYAQLTNLDVDFMRYCYKVDPPVLSTEIKDKRLHADLSVTVRNDTGQNRKVKLECWLIDPRKNANVKSNLVEVVSGKEKTYPIGEFELDTQGEYDCYVWITDAKTGAFLSESRSKVPIKYVPMAISLIEPFYRDAIFATQNLEKFVLDVDINLDADKLKQAGLQVAIRKLGDAEAMVERSVSNPGGRTRVEFECAKLPYGTFDIIATLKGKNGESLAECKHPLQKLPYKKGEVWLGRDLIWRVDGKKFFPLGAWGKCESDYANVGLSGAILPAPRKTIACFYWSGTAKHIIEFKDYIKKYTRKHVAKFRDDPGLFAYFIADEPECRPFPRKSLEGCYQIIREEDPYHPVLISNDSIEGARTYENAADFNIPHPYPTISTRKRINDLGKVAVSMEDYLKITRHKKHVGFMHQGFNYGDFGQMDGRIPTYPELRAQHVLALVCGARSILMFNPADLQGGYPELYIGVPYLVQELAFLGKVILAATPDITVNANVDNVRTLVREMNGHLYLFVSNASNDPREIEISIPGIEKRAKQLTVISENRKVELRGNRFTDKFDTWEPHVYTTCSKPTGLLSVKQICEKIASANAARKKPGNLAFQMFKGDGVLLNASSRHPGTENALWHIVDGIITTKDHYRKLTWTDMTPNKFPDWVEIKLPQKHNIGRVVVYPMEKSLKDYQIQAFIAGKWETVARAGGKAVDKLTHTFAKVNTDKIRIWITATNGPNSRIAEVEIYEE